MWRVLLRDHTQQANQSQKKTVKAKSKGYEEKSERQGRAVEGVLSANVGSAEQE